MPDLDDGESTEMKGSGARPYVLKNVGGVYSCTCPAWRNQSTAIERRTCKHIRKLRGDAAEDARVGQPVAARKPETQGEEAPSKDLPPLLLAEKWDSSQDLTGWWMSEKLDGVRAYWDGQTFLSRLGNRFHAPDWFIEGLPETPLDGELWIGRKAFQKTVSVVRRQDKSDHWKAVSFVVFDAPATPGPFEDRIGFVRDQIARQNLDHVKALEQVACEGLDHLKAELARVEALGGEGLMLRQPGSTYEVGRSLTLLKVKSFLDDEATVLDHLAGGGRHKGRLGALLVELANGTRFAVGTGFSDAERENPPAIGSVITFRYQELSDGGVPRFPSYLGVRSDVVLKPVESAMVASPPLAASLTIPRRFEFVEGTATKFWEVVRSAKSVTVRYGRIGTDGQSKSKDFDDESAAVRHAERLIDEKVGKGYREI
jgi:DNA ligase-1